MEGSSAFHKSTWEEDGTIDPVELKIDGKGVAVPTMRMTSAGDLVTKGEPYVYLMLLGFVEKMSADEEGLGKKKGKLCCYGALPLGVGECRYSDEAILDAVGKLDITVRRTAGYGEKAVFGVGGVTSPLSPWKKALTGGMIYPALKTLSAPHKVPLGCRVKLRVTFVSGTRLGELTIYKIPKSLLDIRMPQSVSFNLNVLLSTGAKLTTRGVEPIFTSDGKQAVSFLVHVGHFIRDKKKVYSVEYCKQKVEYMGLKFSLGNVGGVSFHVNITGKMSKTLQTSIGFKRHICYPLMDTNPTMNAVLWASSVEIHSVTAVFQPSVPKEFTYYDDVLVDNTGKVLKQKTRFLKGRGPGGVL
ncbi:matrix protein [Pacific salmon paramyxovirus]|uniref:Matrix protein n=1 Tax=Pacific salmon paramyxovirus TaxID=348289 RepID=A0A3G2KTK4_9MONO|nr:matrix protein [Salmon aquaparamyxovirus]AYN62578.1 matrix protein [Pacific salmon paramyxovirus]